jgi:hypothetical protein
MKSEGWKSYRTRFLVNAKQLNSSLSFVDHLGRQQRGRKGDYLVESSDGVISIAPRRIFEDIYVPMPQPLRAAAAETSARARRGDVICDAALIEPDIDLQRFASRDMQEIMPGKSSVSRQRTTDTHVVGEDPAVHTQRKLPQPCRDRRSSSSRVGLM